MTLCEADLDQSKLSKQETIIQNAKLISTSLNLGTISELIPPLLYIQTLHSSHAFKYPPSCFNLLVVPLKM